MPLRAPLCLSYLVSQRLDRVIVQVQAEGHTHMEGLCRLSADVHILRHRTHSDLSAFRGASMSWHSMSWCQYVMVPVSHGTVLSC